MFCDSLAREPRITIISKEISISGPPYGYQTDSWRSAIKQKIEFLLENLTEQVIFSDCDIQYFTPSLLFDIMKEAIDLDFYGTRESTYEKRGKYKNNFNTGFYIVKNVPLVFSLFERTLAKLSGEKGDQSTINDLLFAPAYRRLNLKHAFIPTSYYTIGPYEPLGSCFHHATYLEKEKQLLRYYNKYFELYYSKNPLVYGDKYGEMGYEFLK